MGSKEPHSSSSRTNTPPRARHCWDVAQRWLRRVSNFSNDCQSTDTQFSFIGTTMIQSVVLFQELRVTWGLARGIPTMEGERVITVETTAKSRGPTTQLRRSDHAWTLHKILSFFLPHCIGHMSLELLRNCSSCVFGGRTLE